MDGEVTEQKRQERGPRREREAARRASRSVPSSIFTSASSESFSTWITGAAGSEAAFAVVEVNAASGAEGTSSGIGTATTLCPDRACLSSFSRCFLEMIWDLYAFSVEYNLLETSQSLNQHHDKHSQERV